jgi:hypothetical protein
MSGTTVAENGEHLAIANRQVRNENIASDHLYR